MVEIVEIAGGDGVPPEPNWRSIFGRVADREAAACYWRDVINELRSADKLAVANAHSVKRTRQPRAEVINDISADVTTLFRILQRHYPQFMDVLKWQITSRAEFDRLRATAPVTLTDLERAARFLYLQRLSFGGKVDGRNFGVDRRTPARFDVTKPAPMLDELHQRLTGVVIERLPYADLIRRYDGPGTLFFLDPPYWGCEGDYGLGVFERADFERLAEQLAKIAGRFIMTINATDGAREVFSQFDIVEVDTTYTIATASSGGGKHVTELIVRSCERPSQ